MAKDIHKSTQDIDLKKTAKAGYEAMANKAQETYGSVKTGTSALMSEMEEASNKLRGYVKGNYETMFTSLQDVNKNVVDGLSDVYSKSGEMFNNTLSSVTNVAKGLKGLYDDQGLTGVKDQVLKEGKGYYNDAKETASQKFTDIRYHILFIGWINRIFCFANWLWF